jgi:peptide deformylase
MKYKILKHPEKMLRRKCRAVRKVTNHRREKIEAMFKLMPEAGGMGLAAPQIGWNARVFIMNTTGNLEDNLVFVNPFIVGVSGETWEFEEGCLSIPGITGIVERHQKIKIYAWDIDGKPFTAEDHGISGRCMLHEIDHLDGILFIDRAKKLYKGESKL